MRRRIAIAVAAGGAAFAGASWLLARGVAKRLISPHGLRPAPTRRENLLASLAAAGARVHDFRSRGAAADPVPIAAIFATPGEPSSRGTVVFLHGKGGNAAEWEPDALRALGLGYNVLLPDMRGHGPSGGDFVTYGYLEKEDLAHVIEDARVLGLDPERLAAHSCSAGSSIALAWLAGDRRVRGLWLESPFADAREMARHYISISTGVPSWALGLTSRLAVARALHTIRTALDLPAGAPALDLNPLAAAARVRVPVYLVYGERDELIPPRFTRRLLAALPSGTQVWNPRGAGHCHHDDEPERVAAAEYAARWTDFFEGVLGDRERPSEPTRRPEGEKT